MSIYTPRQVSSRSRKGGRKDKTIRRLFAAILGKKTGTFKPAQSQALVVSTQRAWKWKLLWKNLLFVCILAGVLGSGLWMGGQLLVESTIFRLTDIRITGNRIASQRQILELAGLQLGGNLFHFDSTSAVERIETHPWVERAEIKVSWPSAVEITVNELQPFALINVEDGEQQRLRYLNRSGRIFSEVGQGQEIDFPVITGVQVAKDVAADHLVAGGMAKAACQLLDLAARGNAIVPIQAISEIHLDMEQGVILYLVDRPFPIYFGTDRFQIKYNRLVKVLEQLYAKKQIDAVKEIRMDYLDDKVLVTGIQYDG
ncbi:MAG: FtsQ-type POTRA domain-containing protein [Desulfobulbus sp.]|nr:FtsQ-type POTRA domain-containing protein [Desulfobulbus sp.]